MIPIAKPRKNKCFLKGEHNFIKLEEGAKCERSNAAAAFPICIPFLKVDFSLSTSRKQGPRGAGGGWRGEMGSGKSKSVLRQNRARLAAALKVLSRLATLLSIGGLSFGNVGVAISGYDSKCAS